MLCLNLYDFCVCILKRQPKVQKKTSPMICLYFVIRFLKFLKIRKKISPRQFKGILQNQKNIFIIKYLIGSNCDWIKTLT